MEESFVVTRLINPSHFYLFNPNQQNEERVTALEKRIFYDIQNEKKHENTTYESNIQRHDLVGFFWADREKYIRCLVDDIKMYNGLTYYFLFSIDYGVSFYTIRFSLIHKIAEFYRYSPSAIIGPISLTVLPVSYALDYVEMKQFARFENKWSTNAVQSFQRHVYRAVAITFEKSPEFPLSKGFLFGDLKLLTASGRSYNLSEALISEGFAGLATTMAEFQNVFLASKTLFIERWNDNEQTGGILKEQDGVLPFSYEKLEKKKKMQQHLIDKVIEWKKSIRGFEALSPDAILSDGEPLVGTFCTKTENGKNEWTF